MKKLSMLSLLVLCTLVFSSFTKNGYDHIYWLGGWGDTEDLRMPLPAPPAAFLDGDVVMLQFVSRIADLDITIIGETGGEVIYSERFSAPYAGYNLEIPLTGFSGEFNISVEHEVYGCLTGKFSL